MIKNVNRRGKTLSARSRGTGRTFKMPKTKNEKTRGNEKRTKRTTRIIWPTKNRKRKSKPKKTQRKRKKITLRSIRQLLMNVNRIVSRTNSR